MFTNVGRKIKVYAKICLWMETIIFVIYGIVVLGDAYWAEEVVIGIALIIGGPISAWIISLFIYGFGEIVEKISSIEKKVADVTVESGKVEAFIDGVHARIEGLFKKPKMTPMREFELKSCPFCGVTITGDDTFCTGCGQKIN